MTQQSEELPLEEPPWYLLVQRFRWLLLPLTDSLAWALALAATNALRYGLHEPRGIGRDFFVSVALVVACQISIGYATVLYRVRWVIGSFEEMCALALTVLCSTCAVLLANLTFLSHAVPTSAVIAAGAFTMLLTGGTRGAWRMLWDYQKEPSTRAEPIIVFGAGAGGKQVIDALSGHNSPYRVVALLDDHPSKQNLRIRNFRVSGGREHIGRIAKRAGAKALVIAIPSADSTLIQELSKPAVDAGLELQVLPPVSRLFAPAVGLADIRPVTELDLLGRRPVDTEVESIASYLKGRCVLVTGAGGSIGSEICRQVKRFEPSRLVILDRDESLLHGVQLSIEGKAPLDSRTLVVCDIRDERALMAVFEEHRPEVVFHAAALKHLPLLEMWPAEAVKTNILGTLNVLRAAKSLGTKRFINISTDKAADPISVLGYSKRIGERLTAAFNGEHEGIYLSVRFGNVLGSRGSVLTTFREQIRNGGPVTVTHPDVTRYFMTIEEAVHLVIQAGAIGRRGEVLVLDMGSPVRIKDVADRLASESAVPIEIVYTGLRPGEKLDEHLLGTGELDRRPMHPLIMNVPVPAIDPPMVENIDLYTSSEISPLLVSLCQFPAKAIDEVPTMRLSGQARSSSL